MGANRFKWATDGKANNHATFSGEFYRFTFLTDRLVRIEYDKEGVFEDRPSQSFFTRNLPVPNFIASVDENDVLRIETEHIVFTYKKGAPFSASSLQIKLKEPPATVWHYGETPTSLKGTARTLDGADGKIPLGEGVVSRSGISVVDDSDSLVLDENGWLANRNPDTKDIYVFCYGHDYKSAIRDLYKVTGAPALLPRYALGNWWSRYYNYTEEEYKNLLLRFKNENIPFSVAIVDMDWHIVDIKNEDGSRDSRGWTGYTWNEELFPDHKGFLNFLKENNVHTALNLHPAAGIGPHEKQYEEFAAAVGIDPATKEWIPFDILNPEFAEKYFDILHHPYEDEGVDFWWMDWQQGNNFSKLYSEAIKEKGLEKADPLWILNHLHTIDAARGGKRPMLFSRYAGIGSHRYSIGFSGDSKRTWKSLEFQPYFTATASNVGYSWWSHDIGGFMYGYKDDELLVRWMQLGVFSPINRLHSTKSEFAGKEPWNLQPEHSKIACDWLRFRHKLIPYIYTMNYKNHTELTPMIQPMYYSYPECDEAYEYKKQYMFGSELMVAPISEKQDPVSLLSRAEVWLPEGEWYDYFTGFKYEGNKTCEVYRHLAEYPVFAKAGAIIPTYKYYPDNELINRDEMTVEVFPGATNEFTLYQDEGDGERYKEGHFATTSMKLDWSETPKFTIESAEGDLKVIPKKRNFKVKFRGLSASPQINVRLNGRTAKFAVDYDAATETATVVVTAKSVETIEFELEGVQVTQNKNAAKRAYDIILHAQCEYDAKDKLWENFKEGDYRFLRNYGYDLVGLTDALRELGSLLSK